MKTYWANVAMLPEPRRETSLGIEFLAESQKDAVKDAARFARNREKTLGWKFAAIKVGIFDPRPIRPDGHIEQTNLPWFFEWKYDWPGTLEDWVEMKLSEEPA